MSIENDQTPTSTIDPAQGLTTAVSVSWMSSVKPPNFPACFWRMRVRVSTGEY